MNTLDFELADRWVKLIKKWSGDRARPGDGFDHYHLGVKDPVPAKLKVVER